MEIERRTIAAQMRIDSNVSAPTIHGLAAVFNSLSSDLGGFREKIAPGAFKSCISGNSDVRALFNHNPDMILGRTSAKTLRLAESSKGLEFEIDLPGTSYAKDLQASMKRGDINQCSFGFKVDEGGDTWQKDAAGMWTRTIHVVSRLYDIGPVTFPAYAQTECALTSLARKITVPVVSENLLYRMRLEIEALS